MPIAAPIIESLKGRPLADVVAAVAAITDTLAGLQREFGIAHRDVKLGHDRQRAPRRRNVHGYIRG